MNVNAKNVEALAKRKQDENFDLRAYLKMQDKLSEKALDRLVADTARKVWAEFDCTTCARCCTRLGIGVTDHEVQRLAASLKIAEEEFRNRHLDGRINPEDDDCEGEEEGACWRLRSRPCALLKDNRCMAYDGRPAQCSKYPYLYEPDFSFRTLAMIERTFTCPVVFQVFEELKRKLPYRQRGCGDW
jgi:Fe-S-cluster containining protein